MNCESLCILIPLTVVALVVVRYFFKLLFPKPKVSDFNNKYVLITGCDTGFGRKSAILLDQMGFRVIATCLTKDGKESLESVCSDRLVSMTMDVTNSRQIHDVFAEVKSLVADKGVWAVVNNAGYMSIGPLEWYKMEDFKKMADVNLWGLIEVTKTFLPLVKKAEGRVINFASIAGMVSWSNIAPYCVTKYGVEAFSDSLRREMKQWKVKVCIIEPQAFKTPLMSELFGKKLQSLWDGASDEIKQEYGEKHLDFLRTKFQEGFTNGISPDVHLVVDAIVDAVTARDPALRYRVGLLSKVFACFSHLPTAMQDKVIR